MSHPRLLHPKYRPDIDGLRAIAVLAVVAFHTFPDWLKGGFIGVDVFFVISGYLISTIIFENLDKGTFRFTEFYARRIKRIFPALLVVLIACYDFGWIALLADEYKQLGKHIAGGVAFISNFILWNESGYFDNGADTKPLLHLWSLAIEEQFYIVWPLLLWIVHRTKFHFLTVSILVALISFCLNLQQVVTDVVSDFYSPQTRFWELMSGSILAWVMLYKPKFPASTRDKLNRWVIPAVYKTPEEYVGKRAASLFSGFGPALLGYGFWKIDKTIGFPGGWALIPVLGASLVILSDAKAWVNRTILSNKVVVWFGLISYPLYLWHWPLLSFARIVEGEVPTIHIRIGAVALSILFAWITYSLIERPIRLGKRARCIVSGLIVLMMVVGGMGYVTYRENGFGFRLSSYPESDSWPVLNEAADNCSAIFPNWTKVTDVPCLLQKKQGNSIALIGDSHAEHLYLGMSELVGAEGGIAAFSASCSAPYIDISSAVNDPKFHNFRIDAYKLINAAYDLIIHDPNIQTVILAHHPMCSYEDVKDMANPELSGANRIMENGMRRTFSALLKAHKKVFVLFDNPLLPYEPAMCMNRPFRFTSNGNKCVFPREQFDTFLPWSNYKNLVDAVIKDYPGVETYDLSKLLCDKEYCYLVKNGALLYRDRGHLSDSGSRFVAPYVMNAISASK